MPRYLCEITVGAIFVGETMRMISSDIVYWELSNVPMITYDIYIYKPSSRLFDMLGVGGGGTCIVQAREIESTVYKKLFWTSCRTSAPPVLGGGNP